MSGLLLGLDLGTSCLVARLWQEDGSLCAEAQLDNPQQECGADVLQRLALASQGGADRLQRLLIDGINRLLIEVLRRADSRPQQIVRAVAAANPTISHLLAGEPVEPLLRPPHRPLFRAGTPLSSTALGLMLPVPLQLLPLVSGYVGGDLLALLLGSPPQSGPTLYLDLGTNAELALWDGRSWLVSSVAAGPAFEAGNLRCGMRHAPGAIVRVARWEDQLRFEVAGGGLPRGICGSGLFSAIAVALEAGLLCADGRIRAAEEVASNLSRYLQPEAAGGSLQLYRDAGCNLRISQPDLRAFQLAKGAVLAGIGCLLRRAGLAPSAIESVRIAGALGAALPVADLKRVAMLPEIMLDKSRFEPDGVLVGLRAFLLDPSGPRRAAALAGRLKPYPLSGTPAFEEAFLQALDFRAPSAV